MEYSSSSHLFNFQQIQSLLSLSLSLSLTHTHTHTHLLAIFSIINARLTTILPPLFLHTRMKGSLRFAFAPNIFHLTSHSCISSKRIGGNIRDDFPKQINLRHLSLPHIDFSPHPDILHQLSATFQPEF